MYDESGWLRMHWLQMVLLRFGFVFIPQCSYIKEEEFLHSEDVADEIFGMKESKVYGNADLRSFISMFILYRIPFRCLRVINDYFGGAYGSLIKPYTLLIAPRLWICCLSFLCDHLIYKIAINCERTVKEAAIARLLFAGSYAVVVFMARTFSSSLQTILFCALLYTATKTCECKDEMGNYMNNRNAIIKQSFMIGGIMAIGVVLESSFWIFIFCPLAYWFFMPKTSFNLLVVKLCLVFISACIFVSGLIFYQNQFYCEVDIQEEIRSNYVNTVPRKKLMDSFKGDASMSIKLRTNTENGMLVNKDLFTLLGPLPIIVFIQMHSMMRAYTEEALFKKKNIYFFIFFYSFGLLTATGHYSFLITFPLVIPVIMISSVNMRKPLLFCRVWCSLNIISLFYFGFMLRGGVYNSTVFLNDLSMRYTTKGFSEVSLAVLHYKTPVPPKYQMQSTVDSYTGLDSVNLKLNLVDAGNEENILHGMIDSILLESPNTSLLLMIPASSRCRDLLLLNVRYNMKLYKQFCPHVVPENLDYFLEPSELCTSTGTQYDENFSYFIDKFSLNLYLVTRHITRDFKPIRQEQETEIVKIVKYIYPVKE